jgi:hypothetical protein
MRGACIGMQLRPFTVIDLAGSQGMMRVESGLPVVLLTVKAVTVTV